MSWVHSLVGGFICFTVAAAGAAVGAGPSSDSGEYSPDGVELYDFSRDSRVWTRGGTLEFPHGETEYSIYKACGERASSNGKEAGYDTCMRPYMRDLHWNDEGGDRVGEPPAGPQDLTTTCTPTKVHEGLTVQAQWLDLYGPIEGLESTEGQLHQGVVPKDKHCGS